MRFRPCIDIHNGQVKQIVGGSLSDAGPGPTTNFTADRSAAWFAKLYRADNLTGGHVIQLGPGNADAAGSALAAWPGGLQVGGGITAANAEEWMAAGAAAVIVTSWVFRDGRIDTDRLADLVAAVGPEHLVLDLSCRRVGDDYRIATDRWQVISDEVVDAALMDRLAPHCAEFLVHAVDVEGLCRGIESELAARLGQWQGCPITYAGGIRSMADIEAIDRLGNGRIDFTVGSALDIFGGSGLTYADLARRYGD